MPRLTLFKPGRMQGILSGVGNVAKNAPGFVRRHPVLSAVGAGTAVAAVNAKDRAKNLERSIMHEYMGSPASKYASEAFEKFAAHKDAVITITQPLLKTANNGYSPMQYMAAEQQFGGGPERTPEFKPTGLPDYAKMEASKSVGKGFVSEAIAAVRRLLGFSAQKAVDKIHNDPRRKHILTQTISQDPVVSDFERNHPGQAIESYQTMRRFAPTLSTDPNVVRSYLR